MPNKFEKPWVAAPMAEVGVEQVNNIRRPDRTRSTMAALGLAALSLFSPQSAEGRNLARETARQTEDILKRDIEAKRRIELLENKAQREWDKIQNLLDTMWQLAEHLMHNDNDAIEDMLNEEWDLLNIKYDRLISQLNDEDDAGRRLLEQEKVKSQNDLIAKRDELKRRIAQKKSIAGTDNAIERKARETRIELKRLERELERSRRDYDRIIKELSKREDERKIDRTSRILGSVLKIGSVIFEGKINDWQKNNRERKREEAGQRREEERQRRREIRERERRERVDKRP